MELWQGHRGDTTQKKGMAMIAVVCAHNPGRRNLGMYSVDLAAAEFFGLLGRPFEMVKLSGHERVGGIRYRLVRSLEELAKYKAVVYWGDFQQNPVWGRRNFGPRLARLERVSAEAGFERWRRLCLWEGAAGNEPPRLYSVGTCFLGARAALSSGAELASYARALGRFEAVLPRDEGSVGELSGMGLTNVVQGFDCASLLDRGVALDVPVPVFGYAFGRTLGGVAARKLVERVEELTGYRGVPVTWLLGKWVPKWCGYRHARALNVIRRVRFVVTDIYHLCINTMNLGRAVIGIGREEGGRSDTCDDDKKLILFRMAGREDLYVRVKDTSVRGAELAAERVSGMAGTEAGIGGRGYGRRRVDFRRRLEGMFGADWV